MSRAIERLRVAHHLALKAQHSSKFDAAELVRTWPRVAHAALAAQQTLALAGSDSNRLPHRVALTAESLARFANSQAWPGPGPSDMALRQVTSAFKSAADQTLAPLRPSEVSEANWLITSALWTTSQLVGRATRDFSADIHSGRQRTDSIETASVATAMHYRFNAVEHLAAGELNSESDLPAEGTGRQLGMAIATWDIEAHRALLTNPSTAVLHALSHLEAESAKAVQVFINRAVEQGIIDNVTAGRLAPVLRDSSASWETLRDATAQLSFADTAVPMKFIEAARSLQETFGDAARAPQVKDQPTILRAVSSHLGSSVTISATACDLITTGELRAPARAMARILAETPEYQGAIASPIDLTAVHKGQSLPLHPDVRQLIEDPARRVLRNAHEAVERSSGLDAMYRVPAESMNRSRSENPPTRPASDLGTGMPDRAQPKSLSR